MTERVDDLGLNLDMTDFRSYDPVLGRFHQIDPLADIVSHFTPYNFAFNNPILFNDPTGLIGESSEDFADGGKKKKGASAAETREN